MTEVPGAAIPFAASTGEDIGVYPGSVNIPELEFEVARGTTAVGTSDISPNTPEFAADEPQTVFPSTIWNDQAAIAAANAMPLLAIQDTAGGGIEILGGNVDISTLSSKEQFRTVSFSDPTGNITGGFTTTAEALVEYVSGFNAPTPYVPRTWQEIEAESGLTARQQAAAGDEDIGAYPGGGNPPELEFTVARSFPPNGTSDTSVTTPQFAGSGAFSVTPATIWDTGPLETYFTGEGGAFGPSARETSAVGFETIKSTVLPEPAVSPWGTLGGWGEG